MIIDDDDLSSFIIQHLLIKLQFCKKSIIIPSGFSALEYFENAIEQPKELPDLIFLDINMPLVDGFEFIEQFVKYPKVIVDSIKICMISSAPKCKKVDRLMADNTIIEYIQTPINENNFKQLRKHFEK